MVFACWVTIVRSDNVTKLHILRRHYHAYLFNSIYMVLACWITIVRSDNVTKLHILRRHYHGLFI